jgi:quercetin dioxygenase-like cupin family protein
VEASRATGSIFERGDGGRFSGEVWLRTTLTDEEGTNVGIVHFSPGARTHWHRHPGGQFLYGLAGRAGECARAVSPAMCWSRAT